MASLWPRVDDKPTIRSAKHLVNSHDAELWQFSVRSKQMFKK
jgi:hypothetical protein